MIRPTLALVLAAALTGSAGLAARANDSHRGFDIPQVATDPSLIVNAQAGDENDVDDVSDSSQVDQNDQVVVAPSYPIAANGQDDQGENSQGGDAVATPVYLPVPGQYQNNSDENENAQAGQAGEEDQNQSDDQENDSEGD